MVKAQKMHQSVMHHGMMLNMWQTEFLKYPPGFLLMIGEVFVKHTQ